MNRFHALMQRKHRNVFIVNCKVFVYVLTFAYTGLAVFVSGFLPKDFYTFSSFQELGAEYAFFSMFIFLLFFYSMLSHNRWVLRQDKFNLLFTQVSRCCFYFALIQWISLVLLGVVARFVWDMDRGGLLEFQHRFFVSGVSFVYIFAFIYLCRVASGRLFLFICALFIMLDLLYMGKKFVFYLMAVALFRFDGSAVRKTILPAFFALGCGVMFATMMYVIRAVAGGGNALMNIYSFFAEFIGVLSTVGFAIQFESQLDGFWHVVQKLQPFYFDSVGHGLALHPTAYFVAIGGDGWLLCTIIYMSIFYILFIAFSMILGDLVLLILLANIIHFFRHGPDIFLFQFLTQTLVVSIVSYVGLTKSNRVSRPELPR